MNRATIDLLAADHFVSSRDGQRSCIEVVVCRFELVGVLDMSRGTVRCTNAFDQLAHAGLDSCLHIWLE